MQGLKGRKAKFTLVLAASVMIVAVLLFSLFTINPVRNPLTDAIESGESTLKAVDRNHESMVKFARELTDEAEELLKTAQTSQEQAKVGLTYARHTDDEFVLNMAQNYDFLLESSQVMNQGVECLLAVNDNLQKALNYYSQRSYSLAADSASICLQSLEPLVGNFDAGNQSIERINYRYLASGHKDQVKYAVLEYKDAMSIYLQYIELLKTLKQGAAYMKKADEMNDLFNQMQNNLANNAYENAQQLLDELSRQLEGLKSPDFQNAASLASQLNPSLLSGLAHNTAEDLKNQLKDLKGIDSFENYLKAVEKYREASMYLANGETTKAEETTNQALAMLAQSEGQPGQGSDTSRYSEALEFALNSLKMQIRGQPDQS
jgi:hypothetical protein